MKFLQAVKEATQICADGGACYIVISSKKFVDDNYGGGRFAKWEVEYDVIEVSYEAEYDPATVIAELPNGDTLPTW